MHGCVGRLPTSASRQQQDSHETCVEEVLCGALGRRPRLTEDNGRHAGIVCAYVCVRANIWRGRGGGGLTDGEQVLDDEVHHGEVAVA